jgi:PAS domain S-box-containing protein
MAENSDHTPEVDALKDSEKRYETLCTAMLEGFAYCRMLYDTRGHPSDWIFLSVNPAFEHITGVKNITGKKGTDAIPGIKETSPELFEIFGRVAQTGIPGQCEINFKPLSKWLHFSVYSPVKDHFVTLFEDITWRKERCEPDLWSSKQVEDALRESEEKFRGVAERSSDIIMLTDEKGQITYIAPSAGKILGYNPDEIIGTIPADLIHPDDLDSVHKLLRKKADGDTGAEEIEIHVRKKDGTFAIMDLSISTILKNGIFSGMQVIGRDITARKQVEEALGESREMYRELVENINDVILTLDLNGNFTYISPVIKRLYGYAPSDMIGQHFSKYVHPDDHPPCIEAFRKRLKGEYGLNEFRVITRDGRAEYVMVSQRPIIKDGTVSGFNYIMTNITARKEAEKALERSYNILKGIIESPKDVVIFALDRQYRYTAFNENHLRTMKQIWGVDITPGNSMLEYISDPDDRKKAKINFDRALSGESFTLVEAYGDTMLERRWYEDIYNPVADENGKVIGLTLFLTDITNRKQMEEALKGSESRYRTLFEESPISLWEEDFSDLKTWIDTKEHDGVRDLASYFKDHPEDVSQCARMVKVIHINRATMTLFGATSFQEFSKGLTTIFSKESLDAFREEVIALSSGETEFEKETPFRTLQGEPKIVIMKVTVVPGYEKTFSRIFVSGIDITERKNVEGALQQANKKLNMLSSITRHDILNLIMTIRGYLELSEDLVENPELKEYMKKENRAVDSIQRQIEFTRYYQDIGVENPIWQDVEEIVRKVSHQLNLTGITLENKLSGLEIFTDPLVEKVFFNLIENSLRHGEHVTTISFLYSETATGLIISYHDNGAGIGPEYKKKLFQKGFGKHTGLGLFLSREILSITGITISENGEPGKGVNFEILVPKGSYRIPGRGIGSW